MRNIKLVLEYDGSRYQGWQRLGKGESTNTISNKIIEVLHKMTNENIELFCGCRTEVGVHAYGQVVNFKTTSPLKLFEIKNYLNRYLPQDIAVVDIEEMPERFHSSLNAISKTYLYRVSINETPSVFERKYVYHSFKTPDVALMKSAATIFIGKHDFTRFSTAKNSKSTIRDILAIDIYDDSKELQITIEANDFLHNMCRMMISYLLDIGLGNKKVEDLQKILDGDNTLEVSAPCEPKGLVLQSVDYCI